MLITNINVNFFFISTIVDGGKKQSLLNSNITLKNLYARKNSAFTSQKI